MTQQDLTNKAENLNAELDLTPPQSVADDSQDEDVKPSDDNLDEDSSNDDNAKNSEGENVELYGAPESYDYSEIELPENMVLDEELVNQFNPIAKELNLSNKSANKLMCLGVELAKKNFAGVENIASELQNAERLSYEKLLVEDTEFKAFSDEQYDQYLSVANTGIKAVATPEFQELVKAKGLTKHPAFIKTFHAIGKLCSNDRVPNGEPVGKSERPADILYNKTGGNEQEN